MSGDKKSKVKFNVRNAHVALKTTDDAGRIAYETPFAMPGSVSISLEAQGELSPFHADGVKYYVSSSNGGYEGDWELALVTDEFRTKILNEVIDRNKVMLETGESKINEFALGFEVDGDKRGTRFWFYNCSATRPTTESSTTEDTIEPSTDTLTVSASSAPIGTDGKMYIRAKTTAESEESLYSSWFDRVYIVDQEPTISSIVAVYTGSKKAGQTLAKSDFVVKSVMSDSTQNTVTDFAISPTTALSEGENDVTITHQDKIAKIKITAGAGATS